MDPETNIWTLANIQDKNIEEKKVLLSWPGYSRSYDCWVDKDNVRSLLEKRPLISRDAIKSFNFPTRKIPSNLREGDRIVDTGRTNKELVVFHNDPFKAEVIF